MRASKDPQINAFCQINLTVQTSRFKISNTEQGTKKQTSIIPLFQPLDTLRLHLDTLRYISVHFVTRCDARCDARCIARGIAPRYNSSFVGITRGIALKLPNLITHLSPLPLSVSPSLRLSVSLLPTRPIAHSPTRPLITHHSSIISPSLSLSVSLSPFRPLAQSPIRTLAHSHRSPSPTSPSKNLNFLS